MATYTTKLQTATGPYFIKYFTNLRDYYIIAHGALRTRDIPDLSELSPVGQTIAMMDISSFRDLIPRTAVRLNLLWTIQITRGGRLIHDVLTRVF